MQVQTVSKLSNGRVQVLELPGPGIEVMPGVCWGRFDEFFTPAFWVSRAWIDGVDYGHEQYTLGRTLSEEVAACLLGGFGMPAEVGIAAFERLKLRGLLDARVTAEELEKALAEPLEIGGRAIRYRYPRAKSRFLAEALKRLEAESPPSNNREFRDWLQTFTGIGPKTASWITRNSRHCDDVAILDVHIQRAGRLAGVFSERDRVDRDYFDMESRLIRFSRCVGVRLSLLDSLIWAYMKRLSPILHLS